MIRRLSSWMLVLACSLPTLAFDPPRVSPRGDSIDLILLDAPAPVRIHLQVSIDGINLFDVWDKAFDQLFALCDRDENGTLDKSEAARLPVPFSIRQILWGQFVSHSSEVIDWKELDLDGNGQVAREELKDYYRRAGLGGVLVGIGKPADPNRLTDALLKHLDANKDGVVDEAEWKKASEVLLKLDRNDDELLGPGELVENLSYPGTSGSTLLSTARPEAESIPLMMLPIRTLDNSWTNILADRWSKEKRTPFDPSSLQKNPPRESWKVRLEQKKAPVLIDSQDKAPQNARLQYASPTLRFLLRADTGKLPEQAAAARKRLAPLFSETDTNSDGLLDAKELASPKATSLKQILALADRNNDGKLSQEELTTWLDLQEQIAKGHLLLSILDHGCGLFELLDVDHDGALSVREMRTAWERLNAAGCIVSDKLDRAKLPGHLIATISPGQPLTSLGKPVPIGPAWFAAMDRNGDGDVSKREFTGPLEVFEKLDLDHDGLLSAEEASKAEAKK